MTAGEKLALLRKQMRKHGVQACIIPTSDPHLSEYTAEHFRFRQFISPFSGSAGTLIVSESESGLWTDGRYYIQAQHELEGTETVLFRASEKQTEKPWSYIKRILNKGESVALSGKLRSKFYIDKLRVQLEKSNITLKTDIDFSYIWETRPMLPDGKIYALESSYTGESTPSKLERVRAAMDEKEITCYAVAACDCIMWLLNIRGSDIECTPVALCYMLLLKTEAFLYADAGKIDEKLQLELKKYGVELREYEKIYSDISSLKKSDLLGADFSKTNYSLISKAKCGCKHIPDLIEGMKCIKNETELHNIKKAYIYENVALAKSFYTIYNKCGNITECDVCEIIETNRRKNKEYMYPSFQTIAAYGANAAMMHYSPERSSCASIEKQGMLLIDTGAQFPYGTTDTTRTLILGELTQQQRENYTLVLKGNIALAMSVFPENTRGSAVDAAARLPLWERMLDYRCGTGHGVGCCLCVHEGPQRLSPNAETALKSGMTVTDEPGVYIENEYGIRIENHLQVVEKGKSEYGIFLGFEALNYCPIGTAQLEKTLLSPREVKWLNKYNEKSRLLLAPYLSTEENEWLMNYSKNI